MALISPFPFVDFVLKAIRNTIFTVLLAPRSSARIWGCCLHWWSSLSASCCSDGRCACLFWLAVRMESTGDDAVRDTGEAQSRGWRASIQRGREGSEKENLWQAGAAPRRQLIFAYRRLLVGPERTVVIGRANSFAVARGVFYPNLVEPIESADKHRVVFRMLPTYRGVEEEIRECLDCVAVKDLRCGKGLLSFWKFVAEDDSTAPEKPSPRCAIRDNAVGLQGWPPASDSAAAAAGK